MRIRMTAAAVLAGAALVAGAGTAVADDGASATGIASTSPGLVSGNVIQVPVDLGLNLCGDTIDVIGVLNPAGGSECAND
ncbi:chaplin [Streptomyces spiralis]|uniref:chaplin n=1 Tax=Streptomyces spiralis TaxID=66376 RepID=UPI0036B8D674